MTPFCETKPSPLRTARQIVVTTTSAGLAESIASGGNEERAQDDLGSGVNDVNEPADADEGNLQGVDPSFPRSTVPLWAARRLAELLGPVHSAALALLSDAVRRARSWAQFHAKRKFQSGSEYVLNPRPLAAVDYSLVIGR